MTYGDERIRECVYLFLCMIGIDKLTKEKTEKLLKRNLCIISSKRKF